MKKSYIMYTMVEDLLLNDSEEFIIEREFNEFCKKWKLQKSTIDKIKKLLSNDGIELI